MKQRYTIARLGIMIDKDYSDIITILLLLALIESIYVKYAEVQQLLDVNIEFWVKREGILRLIVHPIHY